MGTDNKNQYITKGMARHDGSKKFRHFIEGAAGTYTLVVEVGIAVGNEGDLNKYVGKSDEEGKDEEELELEDIKNHTVNNVYIGE